MIPHETVLAILRKLGIREPGQVVPAAGGSRNASFVAGDLVIRFNTLDPQFRKFENERVAYELLAGSGLPVPAVVALDETRAFVPYDFVVLTRLPGRNLAESWRSLPPEQVRRLAWQAGTWLARLHGVGFDAFGKLSDLRSRPFPSWAAYVDDYARRYLAPARQIGLIDQALGARLERALGEAGDLLGQIGRGALIHCDFHYENMLQEGGRLTGLLDFEWALSGDPTYDFTVAGTREAMIPGSEAAFVEGYTSVRALAPEHARRLAFYLLFLWLENAVMYAREGDSSRARAAVVGVEERLAAYAAGIF